MVTYEVTSDVNKKKYQINVDIDTDHLEAFDIYPIDIADQLYEGMEKVLSTNAGLTENPNTEIRRIFDQYDNWKFKKEVDTWNIGVERGVVY